MSDEAKAIAQTMTEAVVLAALIAVIVGSL